MEINMEVKFKDGSSINLTESQYKELKSIKVSTLPKYDFDFFVDAIPKFIAENGNVSESVFFNRYRRCDRKVLNDAIISLRDSGVINVKESIHKYSKCKVLDMSLR